jgi:hypothetical protein
MTAGAAFGATGLITAGAAFAARTSAGASATTVRPMLGGLTGSEAAGVGLLRFTSPALTTAVRVGFVPLHSGQ